MPIQKKLANARWFFLLVAAIVLFLSWKIVEPLALTLATAVVFAIVLTPLERRLRVYIKNKKASALAIVLGSLLIVVLPLFVIAVLLVDQAKEIVLFATASDSFLRTFDLQSFALFQSLPASIQSWALSIDIANLGKAAAAWAVSHLQNSLSDVVRLVLNAGVFFIALYYMLVERERIQDQLLLLSPLKDKLDQNIVNRITYTVRGVVFGAVIVAIIQAILATVGMAIFGVPGALLWGSLVVVAAQIPMLGVGLIMAPAIMYLLITGDTGAAIGLLIWAIVVVGLVDNIVSPYLLEGRTKMHALLILIFILGGLQLFGPIGFIIGPTILAALLATVDLYKSGILETRS